MDLRRFILLHIKNKTVGNIKDGFEKSSFVDCALDASKLLKDILTKMLSEDGARQKIYNQLQSGGLATTKPIKNDNKKQSFCTEFNQMINNLFGLLGFEFSKYLFILFGAHIIIKQHIEDISTSNTYEEILDHINKIYNFMILGESSNEEIPSAAIHTSKIFVKQIGDSTSNQNYALITIQTNPIHAFFTEMINDVKKLLSANNIIMFDDNKLHLYEQLSDLYDSIEIESYEINTVDDLCINLGSRNIGYDRSFLKMFEILYKESFADIPHELWNDYKPHLYYVENELKLDAKCSKYLSSFMAYYKHIYDETLKSVQEKIPQKHILKVNVTDKCYELLADISFNMLVNMAKKIACNQISYVYFGKSARVQFIQIFQSVLDCTPRLYSFTKSQREILHYVLLPRKILVEAILVVQELKQKEIDDILNAGE